MKTLVFILLFMIFEHHSGFGDIPYKVIKFKIPQRIWQKALRPSPVLKSAVTITLPVNVEDLSNEVEDPAEDVVEDEVQDEIEDEVPEISTNVTEVLQDPVSVANEPIPPVVTNSPVVEDEIITEAPPVPGQVTRFPCECRNRECGCCTGSILERIKLKTCGNITFIPEDFVFDVKLNVNNNTVVRRRVSASDPPPICFNPRRAPFVQVCVEISNIQIRNRNAHACLNINANIGGFPVYSASFRCFNFGASGLQTGKKPRPVSSTGPKPVSLFGSGNDNNGGGFIENAASTIFGEGGLFQGGVGGSNDGPFDGIGEAIGDFLDLD